MYAIVSLMKKHWMLPLEFVTHEAAPSARAKMRLECMVCESWDEAGNFPVLWEYVDHSCFENRDNGSFMLTLFVNDTSTLASSLGHAERGPARGFSMASCLYRQPWLTSEAHISCRLADQ